MGQHAQLIQIRMYTLTDNATPVDQCGRVVVYFVFNFFGYQMAGIQLIGNFLKRLVFRFSTSGFYRFDSFECHFELYHLTRIDTSHSHFRNNSFEVAYERYILFKQLF